MSWQLLGAQVLAGIANGGLYFLVASGLTLLWSGMGIVNLAHGSFFMLAAYGAATCIQLWGPDAGFVAGCILAPAVVGLFGAVLEATLLRQRVFGGDVGEVAGLVRSGAGAARAGPLVPGQLRIPLLDRAGECADRPDAGAGQAWNMVRNASATLCAEAEQVLDKVGLAAKRDVPAGDLSYGDQRTLELTVALSTNPRLLLLDEPTAGMGSEESQECLRLIRAIAERERIPIVFVEHDMGVVFSFATRIVVLAAGKVLIDAKPPVVRSDPRVKEVYFGEDI